MTIRLIACCIFLSLFGLISCKENKSANNNKLSLDPRYLKIEKINSSANCVGPNGDYITKVISQENGRLVFSQDFDHEDLQFMVELSSDNTGYTIDENGIISDTLSNTAIQMIRSHDFHRIQTNPASFYDQIKFEKEVGNQIELFSGIDKLNNPAKIYYDRNIKQIRVIEFLNMMDTTEVIKIEYKKWINSDYGKLAQEIEIVQARKDTFNFDFQTIKINQ